MKTLTTVLGLLLVFPLAARGSQDPAALQPAGAPPQAAPQDGSLSAAFSTEQLEQIVAPIALYPDSLLAQILIAATYPLEIVEAARWIQQNPSLKGDALEKALQQQTWDPSVKSLCGFPDVLKRMNDNLDWTQDLGDAFLGQEKAVMDTVQAMRRKAYEAGNLKSSKELTVEEEADKIIVIVAADPAVIYVPTYYPAVVYGSWGYPYWYYPALYPPPHAGVPWFGFTFGVIWGVGIWGHSDWHHSDIGIDIDHYNKFIDHTENPERRKGLKDKAATNQGKWLHDPAHRKGVGYRDGRVAQRYGAAAGQRRVTRDQARGYGDRAVARPPGVPGAAARPGGVPAPARRPGPGAARAQQPGPGAAPAQRPGPGAAPAQRPGPGAAPAQRPGPGAAPAQRPGPGVAPAQRPGGAVPARPPAAGGARPMPPNRVSPRPTGQSSGSFTGSRSASTTRATSSRGAASRGNAGARGGGRRGRP